MNATAPLGEDRARSLIANDAAVADSKHVIDYYRLSADRRLLFGGGESYRLSYPRDIAGIVRRCMLKVFPQLQVVAVDFAWGGNRSAGRRVGKECVGKCRLRRWT